MELKIKKHLLPIRTEESSDASSLYKGAETKD